MESETWKIGTVKIKGRVVLAPLTPITDLPFRLLCREFGASLAFTEMVNVNAVSRGNKAARMNFATNIDDRPLGIQMIGTQSEKFIKTAETIIDSLCFMDQVFFDINLDCPDRAVLNQGAGAILLKRPERVSAIIHELKATFSIPVTAKMRLTSPNETLAIKTARNIEMAGADALIVHARTIDQGNDGDVRWDIIKAIKEVLSIPIIGSGGIYSLKSLKEMQLFSNCDAIMIGKAAIYNPDLFKEIEMDGNRWGLASKHERKKWLGNYFEMAKRYNCLKTARLLQRARDFFKDVVPKQEIERLFAGSPDIPSFIEKLGEMLTVG